MASGGIYYRKQKIFLFSGASSLKRTGTSNLHVYVQGIEPIVLH